MSWWMFFCTKTCENLIKGYTIKILGKKNQSSAKLKPNLVYYFQKVYQTIWSSSLSNKGYTGTFNLQVIKSNNGNKYSVIDETIWV